MNEENNFNEQPQEFNQTEQQVTYQGEVQGQKKQSAGGLGVASLVTGILSLISCCCSSLALPIILAIVAIVTGAIERKKNPNGLNLAGIICGVIGLILGIVWIVLLKMGVASFEFEGFKIFH